MTDNETPSLEFVMTVMDSQLALWEAVVRVRVLCADMQDEGYSTVAIDAIYEALAGAA